MEKKNELARRLRWTHRARFEPTVDELSGAAAAIIYDGKVDDSEIEFLRLWIATNEEFLYEWPMDKLAMIVRDISRDGVVTMEERRNLSEFLTGIASVAPASDPIISGVINKNPTIAFRDHWFVFTGELKVGTRARAEDEVARRGGFYSQNLSKKTDYLVVGSLGSEAWKHKRFGRKLERAIQEKKEGILHVDVVDERDFLQAIMNQPI